LARTPRPWYWKERGGWYATVEGRRHQLAQGQRNRPEAVKRLRELLVERDRERARPPVEAPLLFDVAADFLADLKARQERAEVSSSAIADFLRRTDGFVEAHGDTPAADVRPHMVLTWLDTHPRWGPTSRHDGVGAVKRIFAWALEVGRIETNPLAAMKKPPRPERRELVIDARKIPDALEAIPPGPFRDLMTFLHLTGCRPSEAARLEAAHLDLARGLAVLPEHKTKKKVRKPRLIYLTPAAAELAAYMAKEHPSGPLFRTAAGNGWTRWSINDGVKRLRRKTGLGRELVAYALRHGMATDLLANGASSALAAEVLGHADTRVLDRVYSHLHERSELLSEAVKAVRGRRPEAE
jgi:integrase